MTEEEKLLDAGFFTLEEALRVLDVTSPETAKNWLCGGHFPGAILCSDGHWTFRVEDVHQMKRDIAVVKKLNAEGKLDVPDLGDCSCLGEAVARITLRDGLGVPARDPKCPVHGGLERPDSDKTYWKRPYANAEGNLDVPDTGDLAAAGKKLFSMTPKELGEAAVKAALKEKKP
jgi:hypothetical protein